MSKLDPRLYLLIEDVERASAAVAASSMARPAGAPDDSGLSVSCVDALVTVEMVVTGPVADLQAVGLELMWVGRHPNGTWWLVAGRIAPSRLAELAAVPHVRRIEAALALMPD